MRLILYTVQDFTSFVARALAKKTETSVEWSQTHGKSTVYYHTVLIDGTEYIKKDEKTPPITVNGAEYIKASK